MREPLLSVRRCRGDHVLHLLGAVPRAAAHVRVPARIEVVRRHQHLAVPTQRLPLLLQHDRKPDLVQPDEREIQGRFQGDALLLPEQVLHHQARPEQREGHQRRSRLRVQDGITGVLQEEHQ